MQAKVKVGFTTRIIFGSSQQEIENEVSELQRKLGIPCKILLYIDRVEEPKHAQQQPQPTIRYTRHRH